MLAEHIRECDHAIADLPEDTKKILQEIHLEAAMAVIRYVARTSLPLWFLFGLLYLLKKSLFNKYISKSKVWIKNRFGQIIELVGYQATQVPQH